MKIGRNDPCPCGSGKKYKKCCLIKEEKRQAESLTRHILMRRSDELIPKLLKYADRLHGKDTIIDAWEEFRVDDEGGNFQESPYNIMFFRWLFFLWTPDEELIRLDISDYPSPHTIGARFLQDNRSALDSLSLKYIQAALADPLSFWQIEDIEAHKGVLARDLLLGRVRFIEDVSASECLHKWDIILGNTMEVDGVCTLNISGPYSLPAKARDTILDEFGSDFHELEEDEALAELFDMDLDLIWFYQDLVDHLFTSALPEVRNTDGEELVFTKSVYEFDPSHRPDILKRLSRITEFEPATEKTRDKALFTWVVQAGPDTPLDNITKGRIEVRRKYIETECNSAGRENQLRRKLKEALPDLITHRKTSSEPLGKVELEGKTRSGWREDSEALDIHDLSEEGQAQLREHLEKMYMNWADTKVPLLGNRTPKEAVKDPEGKRQVISLVKDWENLQARAKNPQFIFDFNKLRKELGLSRE